MYRAAIGAIIFLAATLGSLADSWAESPPLPGDGYSVTNPKFQHYWDHRGGQRVLGVPISRGFDLMGSEVQFFQYGVIQRQPDGNISWLDIMGQELLPYTHFGGLTLPAIDPEMVKAAPSSAEPDYGEKALAFVQANAPDEWEGMKTRFSSTFAGTISYREAFPKADADPALLPLINLEVWGIPISKPARDPRNQDFVYLRFQRGVLHFDNGSGQTRWLPMGEYLKALITGQDLPLDLDQEAKGSKLYRQYDNGRPAGLARPSLLPDTDLFAAFEEDDVEVPLPEDEEAGPIPGPVVAAAVPSTPDTIDVQGSEWFMDQTNNALGMQSGNPIDFIYRVIEVPDYSRFDIPNRTLYVTERDAFVPSWRENRDVQLLWYGGWVAHILVHAEQHWSGRPTTGLQAEQEARYRQKDFLVNHDCDCNDGAFVKRLTQAINANNLEFTEWAAP